jgi:hypothetical protein
MFSVNYEKRPLLDRGVAGLRRASSRRQMVAPTNSDFNVDKHTSSFPHLTITKLWLAQSSRGESKPIGGLVNTASRAVQDKGWSVK